MSVRHVSTVMPFYAHLVIRLYRLHHMTFVSKNAFMHFVVGGVIAALNNTIVQGIFHTLIPKEAEIGKNLMMPHPFGVFIAPDAKIGDDVKIMQYVVFEHTGQGDQEKRAGICVGNNVYIAPGAQILKTCLSIGDGATIGANSVVTGDVPANAMMVGVPARNVGGMLKV
jgi:serine acetyltransferase